jgi:hypothetical protein
MYRQRFFCHVEMKAALHPKWAIFAVLRIRNPTGAQAPKAEQGGRDFPGSPIHRFEGQHARLMTKFVA